MEPNEADAAVRSFQSQRSTYEAFSRRLNDLMLQLLQDRGLDVVNVEGRVKDVASFHEKINRKGKNYPNPLLDVTDLVGLRVIVYYQRDADLVGRIIAEQFMIDDRNSSRKSDGLSAEQFGYLSDHYVISLSGRRAGLPEWSPYRNLKAEVQVRTALQHAWAAVDHKMNYKAERDIPTKIRRKMAMLSAVFELADEQFELLQEEREKTEAEYAQAVTQGLVGEIPLDDSSIDTYLDFIGFDRAMTVVAPSEGDYLDYQSVRSDDATERSELLRLLRAMGFETVNALMRLPRTNLVADLRLINRVLTASAIRATSKYDVVTVVMLLLHEPPEGDKSLLWEPFVAAVEEARRQRQSAIRDGSYMHLATDGQFEDESY